MKDRVKGSKTGRTLWMAVLVAALWSGLLSVTVRAEETVQPQIVRLGYYEAQDFQEGAAEGAYKTGYGYEYEQKIASLAGWKYEYVYGTFLELMEMLKEGKIDLLAGVGYREERKKDFGYSNYAMVRTRTGKYYLCTAPGREDLLEEMNSVLASIYEEDVAFTEDLYKKYFDPGQDSTLTEEEQTWLEEHGELKVGYLNSYIPYSDTDRDGNPSGIVVNVVQQIMKELAVEDFASVTYQGYENYEDMLTDLQGGALDIIFPCSGNPWYAEEDGVALSSSVVSARVSLVFRGDHADTGSSRTAINRNNLLQYDYVTSNYPDAEILMYDSIEDCLEAVRKGEADTTLMDSLRADSMLRNSRYQSIENRQLPEADERCFGVAAGNAILLEILNKGLNVIGGEYGWNATYQYTENLYQYTTTDFLRDHMGAVILLLLVALNVVILFFVRRSRRMEQQAKKDELYKKELSEALKAAQNANQAKTSFLNNMSHDIRTPMNAIIGFTTLALSHLDNRQQMRGYLQKILTAGDHLLSLINDILDMSRIESGQVKIEENECRLPDIMHDLRNILQADVHTKHLHFVMDTVDVVNENIICDKLRLNQVLLNCMSNAIKFTKPGGTVGICVIQKNSSEEGVAEFEFVVRDTGIGMSQEFAEHIFEAFTREQTSTVSGIPGTGLGMSITKHIVDMMGGTIRVKSEKNIGSEFTICLRFRIGSQPENPHDSKGLAGLRVLVADESEDSCVSVTRMLESIGVNAEWTTSGVEAVSKAKYAHENGKPYGAIIIDWRMTDLDGVEVVRKIRSETGMDTPIIILSAYDWTEIEEEASGAGVTAFCPKPLFLSDLYEMLGGSAAPEETALPDNSQVDFSGRKILIVEDNELNLEIAQALIGQTGADVETAVNGKEAVEMVSASEEGYYDLIFMDVQMPVMNGYEATENIRKLDRRDAATLPIIAMTANAFSEDRQKAADAGMNDYAAKPINMDVIIKIMQKYMPK